MTHVAVTPTSGHRLILGMGHSLHPAMWTVVRHYDSRGGNAHFRSQAHLGGGSLSAPCNVDCRGDMLL
eukprot:Em0001g3351a